MANRRTMRKRKKLGQWKQDNWKYYVVIRHGGGVYEFLGTVWGWNRRIARQKVLRRYVNVPNIQLVGTGLMSAYLLTRTVINGNSPKLIRDRKLMEEVRINEDIRWTPVKEE